MDGRTFATDPINLAVEGDFYKMVKLEPTDVEFIRRFLINVVTDPAGRRGHERFLERLMTPDRVVDANRGKIGNLAAVDAALDEFRTNILEENHSNVETAFQPLLTRLLEGDTGFYDEDRLVVDLLHYLCMQHMRTKGMKTAIIAGLKSSTGLDLTRTWDILAAMYAVNIGAAVYDERRQRRLVLIRNHTGVEFITGDQPTLNLDAGNQRLVERLTFYYPLSPALALILTETDGIAPFSTERLSAADVLGLNARIAKAAHRQIFGLSPATLQRAQADAALIVPAPKSI